MFENIEFRKVLCQFIGMYLIVMVILLFSNFIRTTGTRNKIFVLIASLGIIIFGIFLVRYGM